MPCLESFESPFFDLEGETTPKALRAITRVLRLIAFHTQALLGGLLFIGMARAIYL